MSSEISGSTKLTRVATAGALVTAVGASLCCILPVAVAVLGVGSAALGARFEPFRPYFAAATALLLGFAFYRAYAPVECAPGEACEVPANRWRHRILLWAVSVVAFALLAFPYYSAWLF